MANNPLISVTIALRDLASAGLRSATKSINDAKTSITGLSASAASSTKNTTTLQRNLQALGRQAQGMAQLLAGVGKALASGALAAGSAALNGVTASLLRSRSAATATAAAFTQVAQSIAQVSQAAALAAKAALSAVLPGVGIFVSLLSAVTSGVGSIVKSLTTGLFDTAKSVFSKLTSFVFNLKTQIIALVAVLGVRAIIQDLLEVEERLDKIGKLALKIGFARPGGKQDFLGLTAIAEQLNIEVEVLDSSFRVFSRNLGKASRDASVEAKKAFDTIGIDYKQLAQDVETGSKNIFDAVLEVSQAFVDLKLSQAELDDITTVLFGETATKLLPLLRQGKQTILDLIQASKEAGLTVEDAVFERAFRFVEAFRTFRQLVFTTKAILIDSFSAPLKAILDAFTKILLTIRLARADIKKFFDDGVGGWRAYNSLVESSSKALEKSRALLEGYGVTSEFAGRTLVELITKQSAFQKAGAETQEGFRNALQKVVDLYKDAEDQADRFKAAVAQGALDANVVYSATELQALRAYERLRFLGRSIVNFFKTLAFEIGRFIFSILFSVISRIAPEIAKLIGNAIINGFRTALKNLQNSNLNALIKAPLIAIFSSISEIPLQDVSDATTVFVGISQDAVAAAEQLGTGIKDSFSAVKENVLSVIPGLQTAANTADAAIDKFQDLIAKLTELKAAFKEAGNDLQVFDLSVKISFLELIGQLATFENVGKEVGRTIGEALTSGITGTFRKIILESENATEAFRAFASNVLADIAEIIFQFLIAKALKDSFSGGGSAGFFGTIGTALGFNEGGEVPGNRSIRKDVIPAIVAPGEFIQRRDAVDYYGASVMEALNQRLIPRDLLTSFARTPKIPKYGQYNTGGLAAPSQVREVRSSSPNQILALDAKFVDRFRNSSAGPAMESWIRDLTGRTTR